MSIQRFRRIKPYYNVGIIGHIEDGKTTLTSAITKVLSRRGYAQLVPFERIDKALEEKVIRKGNKYTDKTYPGEI